MKTISSLIGLWALFLFVGPTRADEAADKTELIRVETATAAALVANDPKALTEFLAEDWKLVGADGTLIKRAELFRLLEEGILKFTSYKGSEWDIRVYGDAAVVIGHGDAKLELKGEAMTSKDIFTDVFIRRDGKWQCVSSHSSEHSNGDPK